jgi:hypothetical protein
MFWIVLSIIFFLLLGASIFLNIRLYKAHVNLVGFFSKEFKIIERDYEFFDKVAHTNLLIEDPLIRSNHKRIQATRDRYREYVEGGNFPKSDEE